MKLNPLRIQVSIACLPPSHFNFIGGRNLISMAQLPLRLTNGLWVFSNVLIAHSFVHM